MSITKEYTSLQKYQSLTLYFRKGNVVLCVGDEWRQEHTAILTQVLLSTIAALLLHLGWVAQPWVTEGPKPSVCKQVLTLASCLRLNTTHPGTCLYYFLTPSCFRCSSAYLHRCISWLNGSVEGQCIKSSMKLRFLVMIIMKIRLGLWNTHLG